MTCGDETRELTDTVSDAGHDLFLLFLLLQFVLGFRFLLLQLESAPVAEASSVLLESQHAVQEDRRLRDGCVSDKKFGIMDGAEDIREGLWALGVDEKSGELPAQTAVHSSD